MREWRPSEPDPRVSIFRFPRRDDGGLTLDDAPLIAFDVETTGLDRERDRIIEIAMVRVDSQGEVVDGWASSVDPGCDVGPTFIHHITDEAVEGGPACPTVMS